MAPGSSARPPEPARLATRAEARAWVAALWLRLAGDEVRRLARFLAIGAAGLAVNAAVTTFGRAVLDMHYLAAAILATEVTSLLCFCLIEAGVFPDRVSGYARGDRLLSFLAMNNAAYLLRGPMMYALTSGLGVHYLLSNVASIVTFTLVRYALAVGWIWTPSRAAGATALRDCELQLGDESEALRR